MLLDAQQISVSELRSDQQQPLEGLLRVTCRLSAGVLPALESIRMVCYELVGANRLLRIVVAAVGGDARLHRRPRRVNRRSSGGCVWPVDSQFAGI